VTFYETLEEGKKNCFNSFEPKGRDKATSRGIDQNTWPAHQMLTEAGSSLVQ
jgi:hypothetical protein